MKSYKVTTESGKVRGRLILDDGEAPPRADDSNYKEAIKECHAVLDAAGIPAVEAGSTCSHNDPSCMSHVGHRLRDLVIRCNKAEAMIEQLKAAQGNLAKMMEILNEEEKKH